MAAAGRAAGRHLPDRPRIRGPADGTSTEVGHVEARSDRRAIIPPWRGAIIEWLVQDGDPVSVGQPLARLLPEGAGIAPAAPGQTIETA